MFKEILDQGVHALKSSLSDIGIQITTEQAQNVFCKTQGVVGGYENLVKALTPQSSIDFINNEILKHHAKCCHPEDNYNLSEQDEMVRTSNGVVAIVYRGEDGLPEGIALTNAAGVELMYYASEEIEEEPLSCIGAILKIMQTSVLPFQEFTTA